MVRTLPSPLPRLAAAAVAAFALVVAAGCSRPTSETAGVSVEMTVTPDPPRVGMVEVELRFADGDGAPVEVRDVRIEGNMNHAGMTPSFADAEPVGPGHVRADLELTMGGDWFVLVEGTLGDGRRLEEKVDLPGVRLK